MTRLFAAFVRAPALVAVVLAVACGQPPISATSLRARLSVEAAGSGSGEIRSAGGEIACGDTCSMEVEKGTTVELTATADATSTFEGFSGACHGTGPCRVDVTADTHVVAVFSRGQALVTVHHDGPGSVFSVPLGIRCGETCVGTFDLGVPVTLEALPEAGATFLGWSGACEGTGSCVVPMTAAADVTAKFRRPEFTLAVAVSGDGAGSVRSVPAGIDCGSACSAPFEQGAAVVLEAVPVAGSRFAGWSGDCSGNSACVVTMDRAHSATATFTPAPTDVPRALHVSTSGTGSGTVVSTPAGILCGATCEASFSSGDLVVLEAVAANGSQFSGWSGDCAGSSACILRMDAARTVVATFDAIPPPVTRRLQVAVSGTGAGAVVSSPAGIACGTNCTANFAAGTTVALTAVPSSGSEFDFWTGACAGNSICVLTLDSDQSATAVFRAGSTGTSTSPNPVPTLFSVTDATVLVGTSGATVTLAGFGFVNGASVFFSGTRHDATFVDTTTMRVVLSDADTATARVISVTVGNPLPGGGLSGAVNLTIGNPPPVLTSVDPAGADVGSPALTITAIGSGFVPTSVVNLSSSPLATTYVSPTRLTATIPEFSLRNAQTLQFSVRNPSPGGGLSANVPFAVRNPAPTLTSLAPSTAIAGDSPGQVSIVGTGFLGTTYSPVSVVRWNGLNRTTTWVSATELRISLTAADVASPGTAQVTVFNPTPGGGESAPKSFVVTPAPPRISNISPPSVVAGAQAFTLEVSGSGFTSTSVVSWNGTPSATTFVGSDRLQISVSAADVAAVGSATLVVTDAGVATPAFGFAILPASFSISASATATLAARDLVADPFRNVVYATVGGSAAQYANKVVILNPVTGAITGTYDAGSNPSRMALSDDGTKLYVALDGAAKVQRFDLTQGVSDLSFAVGTESTWNTALLAGQLEVMPGAPGTVAIARVRTNVSPSSGGIAVYDEGVLRGNAATGWESMNTVAFTSPNTLYTYNTETTEYGLRRIQLGPSGVASVVLVTSLNGFYLDVLHDAGRLYSTNGLAIDLNGTRAGTFPVPSSSSVRPDVAHGRVFFISGTSLSSYNPGAFTLQGSVTLPSAITSNSRFVRFGTNGVAYRNASQVVFVRSNLIGP